MSDGKTTIKILYVITKSNWGRTSSETLGFPTDSVLPSDTENFRSPTLSQPRPRNLYEL